MFCQKLHNKSQTNRKANSCHNCNYMTKVGDTQFRAREKQNLSCGSAHCGPSHTLAEVILDDFDDIEMPAFR